MLENVIFGVGGWIGGIATTFILRWARKDHVSEEIKRRSDAVALAEKMRSIGISAAEVDAMLASMDKDRKAAPALPAPEDDAIEKREYLEIEMAKSQQEMNQVARRRYERLEMRMQHLIENLGWKIADFRTEFEEEQQAWEAYRNKVADYAGAPWGDGSMRPFIVNGAMSRVTKQRIAELEAELRQHADPK